MKKKTNWLLLGLFLVYVLIIMGFLIFIRMEVDTLSPPGVGPPPLFHSNNSPYPYLPPPPM